MDDQILPYTIEDIKRLCKNENIVWKQHALRRLQQRKILQSEVKECIANGEIIEEYITDKPFASCLVFGITLNNRCLHVVCSVDGELLYIITAYEPDVIKFEGDLKTRREN